MINVSEEEDTREEAIKLSKLEKVEALIEGAEQRILNELGSLESAILGVFDAEIKLHLDSYSVEFSRMLSSIYDQVEFTVLPSSNTRDDSRAGTPISPPTRSTSILEEYGNMCSIGGSGVLDINALTRRYISGQGRSSKKLGVKKVFSSKKKKKNKSTNAKRKANGKSENDITQIDR